MTIMQLTNEAWNRAHDALNAVCSEMAAVPGAAAEYSALCALVNKVQEEGQALVEAAARASAKAG
jgi:hypothetical protein